MIDEVRLNFSPQSLQALNFILGFIMFGVALDMKLADFRRVLQVPKAFLIGVFCQFLVLPALTYVLIVLFEPQGSIGLGMLLVAACPGGNISNFMVNLAKGNTALSVSMTAVSTLAAIVMTPLNIGFWGSLHPDTAAILTEVSLDPTQMFFTILVLLGLPMMVGLYLSERKPRLANKLKSGMKVFSIVFFGLFVVVAFAGNFDYFLTYVGGIALIVFLQNGLAILTGYTAATVVGLPEYDRRAVSIEVGIQNSGLGLILIFGFFDGLGGMAVIAGWWGIWHILSGLSIGFFWSAQPPQGYLERHEATD
ncbi:MAG: bile acid:sodium symporter family protein [Bacteroidota bacterium]